MMKAVIKLIVLVLAIVLVLVVITGGPSSTNNSSSTSTVPSQAVAGAGQGDNGGNKTPPTADTELCQPSFDRAGSTRIFYRAGNSLTLIKGEGIPVDPTSKRIVVEVARGPSFNLKVGKLPTSKVKQLGVYSLAERDLPGGLRFKQYGNDADHYELTPDCSLTLDEYKALLAQAEKLFKLVP